MEKFRHNYVAENIKNIKYEQEIVSTKIKVLKNMSFIKSKNLACELVVFGKYGNSKAVALVF